MKINDNFARFVTNDTTLKVAGGVLAAGVATEAIGLSAIIGSTALQNSMMASMMANPYALVIVGTISLIALSILIIGLIVKSKQFKPITGDKGEVMFAQMVDLFRTDSKQETEELKRASKEPTIMQDVFNDDDSFIKPIIRSNAQMVAQDSKQQKAAEAKTKENEEKKVSNTNLLPNSLPPSMVIINDENKQQDTVNKKSRSCWQYIGGFVLGFIRG